MAIQRSLTDLLYPRRCPLCDGLLEKKEPFVCRGCAGKLHFITGPFCLRCGKPLDNEEEEYCYDCRRRKHSFLRCRAPFLYRGTVKESLMRFKYGGRAEYALFYGGVMAEYGKNCGLFQKIDMIIPVPVHRKRRIERGYNQAELLAEEMSRLLDIPMEPGILKRRKKTRALKQVSKEARSRSLAEAFSVSEGKGCRLGGKRILLVDDIYTTGSTADAVSKKLLQAGAESVTVITLAISPGFSGS
ncbi:MAG: ComF family protein [Lachnospiraceae bacterium]|nr:ComF family protein [Lachnospiraceae bacterium]